MNSEEFQNIINEMQMQINILYRDGLISTASYERKHIEMIEMINNHNPEESISMPYSRLEDIE